MQPIKIWNNLIKSDLSESELSEKLKAIYLGNPPYVAEIIMNSYCPNRCLHCIYPPDYHIYNQNMGIEKWKEAFGLMHDRLGLKRFIFAGRGFSRDIIEAVNHIKRNFDDVEVGLITDGVSAEPFLESLLHLPLDWVDISVDGFENDHDNQRRCKGAFRKTIRILHDLKDSGRFEKVNILTCLTTINVGSVLGMIELLNREGFKNFFLTPVTIIEGYQSHQNLRIPDVKLETLIDDLIERSISFSDTWVEIGIYEAMYANVITRMTPGLFNSFLMDYEHVEFLKISGDNELHICYYPSSLTGTRELILNADGNIIPPKAMAKGEIPRTLVFGNILNAGPDMFRNLVDKEAFSFYGSELIKERVAFICESDNI